MSYYKIWLTFYRFGGTLPPYYMYYIKNAVTMIVKTIKTYRRGGIKQTI